MEQVEEGIFLFHAARTQTWEPSTCEGSHIAAAVVWEKQHVRRYSRRYLPEGLAVRRCAGTGQVHMFQLVQEVVVMSRDRDEDQSVVWYQES